jgi:predicted DNA-binding protein (MmcQ/YjbR family)
LWANNNGRQHEGHSALPIRLAPQRAIRHGWDMTRALVDTLCAAHPGATASDPTTELDSWKVGGKMFACFGDRIDGVCVKTDSVETAQMLIDAGAATRAPYFHKSWVLVSFDTPEDELRHRIAVSFGIIFKGLPKKVQAGISQA